MKIYVASSWRNPLQPGIVKLLVENGYDVYDFRNPSEGDNGFHWSEIDKDWQNWNPEEYRDALEHETAEVGFDKDMKALEDADVVIMVLPCGKSSHLELGYGCAKPGTVTAIYFDGRDDFPVGCEPELMYKMADAIIFDEHTLVDWLDHLDPNGVTD